VPAPLLVALVILATVLLTGCGSSSSGTRRACSEPDDHRPEALQDELISHVCDWQDEQGFADAAVPGAKLFATSGCLACHTYIGDGSANVGAGDLSKVGRRRGIRFLQRFVADPAAFGNDVMPKFDALGPKRLHRLALFLAASKGVH
jgi:Cytochrome c